VKKTHTLWHLYRPTAIPRGESNPKGGNQNGNLQMKFLPLKNLQAASPNYELTEW